MISRRIVSILSLFAFLFATAAPALGGSPLPVAVSIMPQKYFVERIAGDAVRVTVMIPQGGDPHSYEPTASLMAGVSKAALYFSIGLPFEEQWLPRFAAFAPQMRLVSPPAELLAQPHAEPVDIPGLGREARHSGHASEGGPEHHHADPHIWLSPPAMATVTAIMRDALIEALPDKRREFTANAETLLADINTLEQRINALFASLPPKQRSFLTFHHAWGNYAAAFGLREASVEYQGKEPGPRGMAGLIKFARERNIKALVISSGTNRSSAEAIARNIGGVVVEADLTAENWPDNLWKISSSLAAAMR